MSKFRSRRPDTQKVFVQQMKFTKRTRHTINSATTPVLKHRGHPVASLWISGPSDRVTPASLDKLGAKVKQFAEQLSQRLG